MGKKIKRDKFIKIMLTDREYERINEYARKVFQSNSEFIRSSVRHRITEIDKEEPDLRRSVIGELKGALKEFKGGELLEKPDERELKEREQEKIKKREELEKIRQALEKGE